MNKNHLPAVIVSVFFAGTFLMVFSTDNSDQAAVNIIAYLGISCLLAVGTIYWEEIKELSNRMRDQKFNSVLNDAEKFSQEYGDVYVMADKLKQQRKAKKEVKVSNHE